MLHFLRDIKKVGFSNAVVIASSILASVIIARMLGPEKNGTLATLLVYPTLFMTFGRFGISEAVTHILGRRLFRKKDIKIAITQIWFFTSVFGCIICYLLLRYLSNSGDDEYLVMLTLIPIPLATYIDYFSGVFLARGKIGFFNKIYWLPKLITSVLIAIFLLVFAFDISGVLLALIGGPLLMFLILLFNNNGLKAFSFQIKWEIIKPLMRLGSIYALATLTIFLNLRADVVLLDFMSTPYETGIYTKGTGITEYLWQIPVIFSHVVMHRSAVAKDDRAFSLKIAQLLRISLVIMVIASLILFVLAEFLIIGLYGEAFRGSVVVLQVLLPGVFFLVFYKVISTDMAGKGKPWVTLKAMAMAFPINIVLNLLFIPKYGSVGAALGSTISYTFAAFLYLHLYSKEIGIPIRTILAYKESDFIRILDILNYFKRLPFSRKTSEPAK